MQKRTILFLFGPALLGTTFSCRKGEFAPEHYQAKIEVASSQLSTTRLEVQFDDSPSRDSLVAGGSAQKVYTIDGKLIAEGKSVKFKVYKAGTNDVIADTSFILHKNSRQSYNIIYNEDLGLGGFLNGTNVPSDSIRVRFIYHDNTTGKKFPALEWQFYQTMSDLPYYDSTDNVKLVFSLDTAKYSGDFYIPIFRKDKETATYLYVRLKNPATGEFLYLFPDVAVFDTPLHDLAGGNVFFINFNLVDNGSDSGIDYYNLESSYLQL